MKRKIFSLLCSASFCANLFLPTYAWNLKDKIEEAESESSSEDSSELMHYEDDYVQFDYDEQAGISISNFIGMGLARYTFSDIRELANSEVTVKVQFLINTSSISDMNSYIEKISEYDDFDVLDEAEPLYTYHTDDLNVIESVNELSDDYYLSIKYSTDSDSFNISDSFDKILSSFEVKEVFDSEIPTSRPKTSDICEWYYAPDWVLDDVNLAISICKQYRSLKISLDEATSQIQEISDLVSDTAASACIDSAMLALKYSASDLSDAISELETFVDRQVQVN